jgi:hypothetical protein
MPEPTLFSADALFQMLRQTFSQVPEHRPMNVEISLTDVLMSGLALFSLKDPSLLAFDERRAAPENLQRVYYIQDIPSDTQMRTILDEVSPEYLRASFKHLFHTLQREKVLRRLCFMGHYYLVALDGTGYFSSKKVHCEHCLERHNAHTGEITYTHQLLGAAIVCPGHAEVVPLYPEPIIKQDGSTKNDCERNAAKRFLQHLREDHPHVPFIITEDALSANAPHIRELQRHQLHFILGVKPGDHQYLFDYVTTAHAQGATTEFEQTVDGVTHRFRWLHDVPLNASNPEVRVNFLEYWEIRDEQVQHFSWITDFVISTANAFLLMQGGRARWKVENETFNTLKNQGYHFEHNFGHGQRYLSVIFALLMLLAFAIDQVQQLACPLFQAAWRKMGSKRRLWERLRGLFYDLPWAAMTDIWRALACGYHIQGVIIIHDST